MLKEIKWKYSNRFRPPIDEYVYVANKKEMFIGKYVRGQWKLLEGSERSKIVKWATIPVEKLKELNK